MQTQDIKIPLSTIGNEQRPVHVTVEILQKGNHFRFYNKANNPRQRFGAMLTELIDPHGKIETMETGRAYLINGEWNIYVLSVTKI